LGGTVQPVLAWKNGRETGDVKHPGGTWPRLGKTDDDDDDDDRQNYHKFRTREMSIGLSMHNAMIKP